jgi:tRNA isopentenyl-2-thiomethyl-A-37 hydroxylase MiaE
VFFEQQQVSLQKRHENNDHSFTYFLVLLNTELKTLESQNDEIRHEINRCHTDLQKYDDKLQILDNMTHLATQSLEVYFQTVRKILQKKKLKVYSCFQLAYGKFTCICY